MDTKNYIYELKIHEYLGHGSSGVVCACDFLDKKYAFKEISMDDKYKTFIQPRLEKISQFYGDSDFVFPYKLIYNDPSDNLLCGYIMDHIKDYTDLCDLELNYKEKLRILYKAREVLDKLHSEYKHIHTDINSWNFVYNEKIDKVFLLDFDTCIDLNKKNDVDFEYLNTLAMTYCKYNGFDIDLDIFMFNMLTFSILNDIKFYDSFYYINDGNFGCIESNKAIQILKDYDDIEFKKLRKEYVIDYL